MKYNHEQRTQQYLSNFIERHAGEYRTDPWFRMMVNSTVLLTAEQVQESSKIVGGRYGSDGKFLGL
jgi:hypothetical protein